MTVFICFLNEPLFRNICYFIKEIWHLHRRQKIFVYFLSIVKKWYFFKGASFMQLVIAGGTVCFIYSLDPNIDLAEYKVDNINNY